MLNVDRSTVLVRLVVILWVVLENLRLLFVLEVLDQIVHTSTKLFPPRLAINEPESMVSTSPDVVYPMDYTHFLGEVDIELACPQKSKLRSQSAHACRRA